MNASILIQFPYDTTLVALRREHAPRAYWLAADRAWRMTNTEASAFLLAAGDAMMAAKSSVIVEVDGTPRRLGMLRTSSGVPCLPYPKTPAEHAEQNAWCLEQGARFAKARHEARKAAQKSST
jgi:hypothetical protein